MPTPRLEARGLTIAPDGIPLLRDVGLTLVPSEIATIDGASGAGKTSLLRVLAGLSEPARGEVLVDGTPVRALSPRELRIKVAYVPQTPVMLEGTVADNVAAGPRLRGATVPTARVASLLAEVGLAASFSDKDALPLSGGERQRVALARALANEPTALLLDEPTSALDPVSAGTVLSLVRALAARGCAVLVVSHVHEHREALGGTAYACEGGTLKRRASAS